MRIEKVKIKNYKSIVDCELSFHGYYTAISGKNNAGKSNLLKSLFSFFEEDVDDFPFVGRRHSEIDFANDYPQWKEAEESIEIEIIVAISKESDAGIFRFIFAFLAKDLPDEEIHLKLGKTYQEDSSRESVHVIKNGCEEEVSDYFVVQEIHKRLRSSGVLFFHNSTKQKESFFLGDSVKVFGDISASYKSKLNSAQDSLFKVLRAIAQKHKEDIVDLLGRLDDKYEVEIAIPRMNLERFPMAISLGDKKHGVPLEDWGSGTQNKTKILLSLLQAKRMSESASESDKITPIIVIEEPESFLHPSAQSEFGKLLQDLAKEFGVQVIATTHSPHMLSLDQPNCNILLCRNTYRNQLRETYPWNIEDSENWMEPFAVTLGIDSSSFRDWKDIIFKDSDELLLVEGDIDQGYFELLSQDFHGGKKLDLSGEIFAYGGSGFFDNSILLKFILNRFPKLIITYDLDVDAKVSKALNNLGLKKNEDYFCVGKNEKGKKDIEGLLPQEINSSVFSDFSDLVITSMSSDRDAAKEAKQKLKRERFNRFKQEATIENGYFEDFYALIGNINKAIRKKRK